jgi:hypothetical protein
MQQQQQQQQKQQQRRRRRRRRLQDLMLLHCLLLGRVLLCLVCTVPSLMCVLRNMVNATAG